VVNEERREARELQQQPRQHQQHEMSYSGILVTHPHVFAKATNPLEADSWLRMTEAKFGLLCYSETQKTLFASQQLCGSVSAWWATLTTTLPVSYLVPWAEFREAFRGTTSLTTSWTTSSKSSWTLSKVPA
jgi:hypothetical protein